MKPWSDMSEPERQEAAFAAVSSMTYREAARRFGVSVSAVAGAVYRYRRRKGGGRKPEIAVPPSPLTREKVDEIAALVGATFHVSPRLILAGDRAHLASVARYVVYYLLLQLPRPSHQMTASGLRKTSRYDRGLTELSELLGFDRSTLWHAGRVVEDMRDDPPFDAAVTDLEQKLGLT